MATAENILALASAALNVDQKMVNSMCRVIAANERAQVLAERFDVVFFVVGHKGWRI